MNSANLLPSRLRQACGVPSTSGRAPTATRPAAQAIIGRSLPGGGEGSHCHQATHQNVNGGAAGMVSSGFIGKRNAKKLHKVLKMSRKRVEQSSMGCSTLSALASPSATAPTHDLCHLSLEAELQALTQRLRRLSESGGAADVCGDDDSDSDDDEGPSMPRPSAASGTTMATATTRRPAVVVVPEVPAIDFDLPEFAARCYEGAGRVLVCQGSKCQAKGALALLQAVSAVVGDSPGVEVLPCKCLGKCAQGAAMRVKAEGSGDARGQLYTQLAAGQAGAVLDGHFGTPRA